MISNAEYAQWMARHLSAFGIYGSDFAERFKGSMICWQGEFTRRLFTLAELNAATDDLIGSESPKRFADDHRAFVVASIARRREERRRAKDTQSAVGYSPNVCIMCGNSGWVVVPAVTPWPQGAERIKPQERWLPHHVTPDGREVYLTMGVRCNVQYQCVAMKGTGLTLPEYEKLFPTWEAEKLRVETMQREALVNEAAECGGMAGDDGALGNAISKIIAVAAGMRRAE